MAKEPPEMPQSSDKSAYLPGLDSLRGVAALIVVVSHSANGGLLPALFGRGFGGMGVTLFYSLSGFLMAYLYLHRPFNGEQVLAFVTARIARVFPLYYACLCLAVCLFVAFGWVLYTANNSFDFATAFMMIRAKDVLWSIPTEVQFYVVFLILWWGRDRGLFWIIALGFIALEILCVLFLAGATNTILKWGHVFACGVLIALWLERWPIVSAEASVVDETVKPSVVSKFRRLAAGMILVIAWLSPVLLFLSLPQVRRQLGYLSPDGGSDPVLHVIPLLILVLAIYRVGPWTALEHPWLRWSGSVSYGVYLLHMPIMHAVKELAEQWTFPKLLQFPMLQVLTLVIANLSRCLLELPAQRCIRRFVLSPRGDRINSSTS